MDSPKSVTIAVSVAYAALDQQYVHGLTLARGACVADALAAVADVPGFDALLLDRQMVGIFGEVCEKHRILRDGDRVEIYRPLKRDAKAARHVRAAQQKSR